RRPDVSWARRWISAGSWPLMISLRTMSSLPGTFLFSLLPGMLVAQLLLPQEQMHEVSALEGKRLHHPRPVLDLHGPLAHDLRRMCPAFYEVLRRQAHAYRAKVVRRAVWKLLVAARDDERILSLRRVGIWAGPLLPH